MENERYNSQFVEFHDKDKIIDMRGHFSRFVCGALTMLDQLAEGGLLDAEHVKFDGEGDFLQTSIKFRTKSDYDLVKETIDWLVSLEFQRFADIKEIKKAFKKLNK